MLLAVSALAILSVAVVAQDDDDDVAPPPLKILSADEKAKLAAVSEVKQRTKLALDLMEIRMKQSEAFDAKENWDQMFVELGAFQGLMDDMLEFLTKSDKDNKKVLNNFKRFEIGLRMFTPRLELVRSHLPIRYELYVRNLIKNLRAARSKAIEPLFDDTVVPTSEPPTKKPE